jgi:aspartyl-tRNA(Asn)/glutamyl-tRNA(Gln) amidotransferase subunit A
MPAGPHVNPTTLDIAPASVISRRTILALGLAGHLRSETQTQDLADLTLLGASRLLRTKAVSPVDLVKACLGRIEKLNPILNAYITVCEDSALAQARRAEYEVLHGRWMGPLHGIPIGLKDNIDTAGVRTTAASNVFAERIPLSDANVVGRLKRTGAVLMGKHNLHEFAFGGSSVLGLYTTLGTRGSSLVVLPAGLRRPLRQGYALGRLAPILEVRSGPRPHIATLLA